NTNIGIGRDLKHQIPSHVDGLRLRLTDTSVFICNKRAHAFNPVKIECDDWKLFGSSTEGLKTHFEWDPRIMNERLRRSSSFVCPEYTKPACFRPKPKTISVNPWTTNSQAVRQLCSVSRFGPKRFFINNQDIHQIGDQHLKGDTTQALGLCYQPMTVDNL
ncbi:hypothetical protein MAR_029275, partial [Mya arenaria]